MLYGYHFHKMFSSKYLVRLYYWKKRDRDLRHLHEISVKFEYQGPQTTVKAKEIGFENWIKFSLVLPITC